MEITFPIELPDDWYERVAEKLLQNGDAVIVTRCRDCQYFSERRNQSYKGHFCERMTEFVQQNDFCSYAKKKLKRDEINNANYNPCLDCKYYKKGKCTHEHADYCQQCELWTPNWFTDEQKGVSE